MERLRDAILRCEIIARRFYQTDLRPSDGGLVTGAGSLICATCSRSRRFYLRQVQGLKKHLAPSPIHPEDDYLRADGRRQPIHAVCYVNQNLGVEIFRVRHFYARSSRACPDRPVCEPQGSVSATGASSLSTRSNPDAAIFKNGSCGASRTSTPCLLSTPKISSISEPTFAGKSMHNVILSDSLGTPS